MKASIAAVATHPVVAEGDDEAWSEAGLLAVAGVAAVAGETEIASTIAQSEVHSSVSFVMMCSIIE